MQTPAAYLFDLDGTLIDSEPWHKLAEIKAFAQFGIQLDDAILNPYMGNTLPMLVNGINATYGKSILVDEFLEVEQPILQAYIDEEMELFPDARKLIEELSSMKKAIVTSSMEWYLNSVLNRFPILRSEFEVHICQADVKNGKPHAEPYLLAMKLLSGAPDKCLVLEDSPNGVASGKAAGCYVVGVDRHNLGNLLGADHVIPSLDEPYFSNV
jgi:HAD superfamily hydrolase (TIGR01509 family)